MKIPVIAVILFIIISSVLVSGCQTVQPWERERLSNPNMIFDDDPVLKGIENHFLYIREGSEGGDGAQSGGCGCG
ncbi:MAG: DUF4266 domain-containing protein [Ignavibacteria bacterium]|jgi:hypothetical protein